MQNKTYQKIQNELVWRNAILLTIIAVY